MRERGLEEGEEREERGGEKMWKEEGGRGKGDDKFVIHSSQAAHDTPGEAASSPGQGDVNEGLPK